MRAGAGKGSDKGKVERAVRTLRESFGEVLRRGAGSIEELGGLLEVRSEHLLDRLRCPVTGGTVREALEEGASGIAAVAVERGTV